MTITTSVTSTNDKVSFRTLAQALDLRLKNHSKFAQSRDWTTAQWLQAIVGELGEFANVSKKVDRGDFSVDYAREEMAKELADVQAYLFMLSTHLDIDLGKASVDKFNEVSKRIDCPMHILGDR